MKMFVWDGVLTDYTSGMIVVLANSLEEAREVAMKTDKYVGKETTADPTVYETPSCVYVYGGG